MDLRRTWRRRAEDEKTLDPECDPGIVVQMSHIDAAGGGALQTYEPRRESRVLWLKVPTELENKGEQSLTDEQTQSAMQVHGLLKALAERKFQKRSDVPRTRRHLPHIDDARWNQNLLIDGSRGSGKTALLVTLLDLWNSIADADAAVFDEDEKVRQLRRDDRKDKRKLWGIEGAWTIVPVGLVDLQPIPKHTPVLLHLAEKLIRVVESLEDGSGKEDCTPPWHLAEKSPLPSRTAWERLLRGIVAGWDHASAIRWGKLNAEDTFHELDRATREYQDLPSEFVRFVDALTEDYQKARCKSEKSEKSTPLFVLAIDDADLEIERAQEVIEALRIINHPRLAFVLTGDSDLFYRAVEQEARRRLYNNASTTTRLARDLYDKVVPPSHRCAIPPIPVAERAKHIPEVMRLTFPVTSKKELRVPLDGLLRHAMISRALPSRIRALRDVVEVARGPDDPDHCDPAVVRTVMYLWNHAAPPEEIRELVYPVLDTTALQVDVRDPDPTLWFDSRRSLRSAESNLGSGAIRVVFEGDHIPRPGDADALSSEAFGALVLADNVAFEFGRQRVREGRSDRIGFRPMFAEAKYTPTGEAMPLRIAWPFPDGLHLLDLCNISIRWDEAFPRFSPSGAVSGDDIDTAARWFATLVLQLRQPVSDELRWPFRGSDTKDPGWGEIARTAVRILRSDDEGDDALAYREWVLGRLLLFAAPESGLPEAKVSKMLDLVRAEFRGAWEVARNRTMQQRIERMRWALREKNPRADDKAAEEVLKAIDDGTKGHPWHVFVKPRVDVADTAFDVRVRFKRAMDSLGLSIGGATAATMHIDEFDSDSLVIANALADMAETFRGRMNERPDLVRALWARAALELGIPGVDDVVTFNEFGAAKLAPLVGKYDDPATPSFDVDGLVLRNAGPLLLMHQNKALPALLQYLYKLVWDYTELNDPSTTYREVSADTRWTRRVSGRLDNKGIEVPWPVTPWGVFEKVEWERRMWNEELSTMIAARGYPTAPTRRAEIPAIWFIAMISAYRTPLSQGLQPPQYSRLDDIISLVMRGALHSKLTIDDEYAEVLRARFLRWGHGVFLLLAPESKAPERVRRALLSELKARLDTKSSNEHRALLADTRALNKLRLDRMLFALGLAAENSRSSGSVREVARILTPLDKTPEAVEWRELLEFLEETPAPKPT